MLCKLGLRWQFFMPCKVHKDSVLRAMNPEITYSRVNHRSVHMIGFYHHIYGRYSDFAIIARSLDSYSGILDTSLEKAHVPHFMASPKSISSFEAIKLINTAYGVIVRRFATADVLTYAKCGLIGATRDECDLFEMYVTKWNINGKRFTDGVMWNMNPRGFEAMKEGDAQKLLRINDIRDRIITPLSAFAENTREAKTVRAHAEALLEITATSAPAACSVSV